MFEMLPRPLLSASLGLPTVGRGWSHSQQNNPARWTVGGVGAGGGAALAGVPW